MVSIKDPDFRFRLLGIFPLVFFFAQAAHYWGINQLGHMLWMCNVGDLLLAFGLFLKQPVLIRIAGIWMVPGFVIWFRFVVLEWGLFLSSVLAHVGGLLVGFSLSKYSRASSHQQTSTLISYTEYSLVLSRYSGPTGSFG